MATYDELFEPARSRSCSPAASTTTARLVKVEIISKDSQSNSEPRRGSRRRTDPPGRGRHHRSPASTPDTTNPVADQAEVNEVPCITTDCPWQPYFFGRNGDPAKGFDWTYHFFWGLEDVIAAFLALWDGTGRGQDRSAGSSRTTPTATPGATPSAACRRRSPRPATS